MALFAAPDPQRGPDTRLEEELRAAGFERLAGGDEAGRGPLAGPVVAAAVILPLPCPIAGINDSKKLTARQREQLYEAISTHAEAVAIGIADVATIDRINILQATRAAMCDAVRGLVPAPDCVLVDALTIPGIDCAQRAIIHGDARCLSIAAASIVAKVTRDRILRALDEQYPGYGFASNKGYGTPEHLAGIARLGICPAHRRSFAPVRVVLEQGRLFRHEEGAASECFRHHEED